MGAFTSICVPAKNLPFQWLVTRKTWKGDPIGGQISLLPKKNREWVNLVLFRSSMQYNTLNHVMSLCHHSGYWSLPHWFTISFSTRVTTCFKQPFYWHLTKHFNFSSSTKVHLKFLKFFRVFDASRFFPNKAWLRARFFFQKLIILHKLSKATILRQVLTNVLTICVSIVCEPWLGIEPSSRFLTDQSALNIFDHSITLTIVESKSKQCWSRF